MEVVYILPMDAKAAVNGLTIQIGDKTIIGKVQQKDEARKTYQSAIEKGHGGYLLEENEESPDVFSLHVGNLPPNSEVGRVAMLRLTIVYFCFCTIRLKCL